METEGQNGYLDDFQHLGHYALPEISQNQRSLKKLRVHPKYCGWLVRHGA